MPPATSRCALHDWDVDFACWCHYKYVNAGPGAVGGCFVHERHGADPALVRPGGWWGHDPATRFDDAVRVRPVPGAEGWQVSNPPILAMAPVRVSLDLFAEVGMDALRARSRRLTAFLEELLDAVARPPPAGADHAARSRSAAAPSSASRSPTRSR